jgi:hypothetical protein
LTDTPQQCIKRKSATDTFCQDSKKKLQPGPEFNEKMQGIRTLCFLASEFNFNVEKPFKSRLDEFYKDPLNKRIPASLALQYARDEMNGRKTDGQLLDELNSWRKIVNEN